MVNRRPHFAAIQLTRPSTADLELIVPDTNCPITLISTAFSRFRISLPGGRCIRPGTPLSIDDARRAVDRFVTHYNTTRLHSAIGYVTPLDMLEGRQKSILEARDRKLEEARMLRGEKRRQQKLEMTKKLPAKPRIPEVDSSVRQEDRATLGTAPSA
jgi:hypothetical protein